MPDPPGRVGRELEALPPVELLDSANQAHVPLLDQVEKGEAAADVTLGDRDDESEIGLDQSVLGAWVPPLDQLGEASLVGGAQQRDGRDLLEVGTDGVGRNLDRLALLLIELLRLCALRRVSSWLSGG